MAALDPQRSRNRGGRRSKADAEPNGLLQTTARWQQTRIGAIIVQLAPLSQAIARESGCEATVGAPMS